MIGRRRDRSTSTPAGRPTIRNAAVCAAFSRPIWKGVVASVVAATSGMAVRPMLVPTMLTVWAPQNRRN